VPFFSVRERLKAMVTGEEKEHKEDESPDDFFLLND
jgi:hypothetical protein